MRRVSQEPPTITEFCKAKRPCFVDCGVFCTSSFRCILSDGVNRPGWKFRTLDHTTRAARKCHPAGTLQVEPRTYVIMVFQYSYARKAYVRHTANRHHTSDISTNCVHQPITCCSVLINLLILLAVVVKANI